MSRYQKPKLNFSGSFPKVKELGSHCVLIFDSALLKFPKTEKWISGFTHSYGAKAGEDLKDIKNFSTHIEKILKLSESLPSRELTFVILGGGSVGDFGGFAASIYKRGVRLIQIPSTWLAAVDSAHGGKTALNVKGFKNQLGTFYQAEEIYLVKDLLCSQPKERWLEAFNEILKIALIENSVLWNELNQSDVSEEDIWDWLPLAIAAKYKIVEQDPFEEKGYRQILNLGHTMGHVFESLFKISHGESVGHGLKFSLLWSNEKVHQDSWVNDAIQKIQLQRKTLPKVSAVQMRKMLLQDKKRDKKDQVNFVFLRHLGSPQVEPTSIDEVILAARRQGLVK
ncbi:MAG: hypothetical protein AB7O96_01280 [Pseudobdellovibrionaceae bacterium]